jgi:hypothetical protein
LQSKDVERYLVFVNKTKTDKNKQLELNSNIQQLLEEYQNQFPKPLLGVKFTNLFSGLSLDHSLLNHSISLQNKQSQSHFQQQRPLIEAKYQTLK